MISRRNRAGDLSAYYTTTAWSISPGYHRDAGRGRSAEPGALPLSASSSRADTERRPFLATGIDFSAQREFRLTGGFQWNSERQRSLLLRLQQTSATGGDVERYDGTARQVQHHAVLGHAEVARQLAEHVELR